jgi:hypothetical protein
MAALKFLMSAVVLATAVAEDPVLLGAAGDFAILSKMGVTNVPSSVVTGNVGVSPITASAITGFTLTADALGAFSTSSEVKGKFYASDYGGQTGCAGHPCLTQAVSAMEAAYDDAALRTTTVPGVTNLGGYNVLLSQGTFGFYYNLCGGAKIDGYTLTPGVYTWTSAITMGAGATVTLHGGPEAVFILQTSGAINVGAGTKVILSGGVLAKNIFWQAAGAVSVGAGAVFEGVILTKTAASFAQGASLNGRVMAQTAVTLIMNTITAPAAQE